MTPTKPTKKQLAKRAAARANREAVLSAGGKALYILLDAEHAKKLARLQRDRDATARDVVQDLISRAKQ